MPFSECRTENLICIFC